MKAVYEHRVNLTQLLHSKNGRCPVQVGFHWEIFMVHKCCFIQ